MYYYILNEKKEKVSEEKDEKKHCLNLQRVYIINIS